MSDRDPNITLGRISGVFGLKGWVKVYSYTDPREAILDYQPWLLGPDAKPVEIRDGKPHGKTIVASLPGVDTPEQARTLVNQEIRVTRAALPASEEGAWYWSDLEGLTVVNTSGVELGTIQRLFETGTIHSVERL